MQDVRYTARSLRRSPGFAAVVVLTPATGVGATTALFSTVNATLLRCKRRHQAIEDRADAGSAYSGEDDRPFRRL